MTAGYVKEAIEWRDWLLRAVAGDPAHLQIMYGHAGERRLTEYEVDWLAGYENSAPVRVGNAASQQFQLDVYGEVVDSLHQTRQMQMPEDPSAWSLQRAILEFLEAAWKDADEGIWEVRGERRDFTHSKVMAWVAFDRAVKAVEQFGLDGPVDTWRGARDEVHREVCERGFDAERNTFTQYYGSKALDASTLMIAARRASFPPLTRGSSAPSRPSSASCSSTGSSSGTTSEQGVDGLPPGEGVFLPCSFWLADNLCLIGPVRRGRRALRAPDRARQRRGADRRGVRPGRRSACSGTSRRRSRTCRS